MQSEETKDTNNAPGSEIGGNANAEISIEELQNRILELETKLSDQKTEMEAFRDRYLRVLADAENMKKRFDKERSDLLLFGLEKLVTDLLPVLDSVDNALADIQTNQTINTESLKAGFELVNKQLTDTLVKHGLAAVGHEQADFDPNLHQAIQRIESENVTKDTVKQVFVKGYTLNGRLVRPAMVSVEVPN